MKLVIVFDADNTIWDADSVFRNAQLSMLKAIAEEGFINDPESKLDLLRAIDTELGKRARTFEYDFRLLPAAILNYHLVPQSIQESVSTILTTRFARDHKYATVIEKAYLAFDTNLKKIPNLYPDTTYVLDNLRTLQKKGLSIATLLYSEGNPKRIEHILKVYRIRERNWFNQIVLDKKNIQAYEKIKKAGLIQLQKEYGPDSDKPIYVMIGDNLERDIKYANQAGFVTVYKPSRYKGVEKPRSKIDNPTFIIKELMELLGVLERIMAKFAANQVKFLSLI